MDTFRTARSGFEEDGFHTGRSGATSARFDTARSNFDTARSAFDTARSAFDTARGFEDPAPYTVDAGLGDLGAGHAVLGDLERSLAAQPAAGQMPDRGLATGERADADAPAAPGGDYVDAGGADAVTGAGASADAGAFGDGAGAGAFGDGACADAFGDGAGAGAFGAGANAGAATAVQPSEPASLTDSAASDAAGQLHDTLSGAAVKDIFSLARHNRVADLTALLDRGVPVDIADAHGNTILIVACQNGLKRVAKLALRRGCDIDSRNSRGNTALHFCFAYGYGEGLGAYLVSKGADPAARNDAGFLPHEGIG